jgi:hypothetical protein
MPKLALPKSLQADDSLVEFGWRPNNWLARPTLPHGVFQANLRGKMWAADSYAEKSVSKYWQGLIWVM